MDNKCFNLTVLNTEGPFLSVNSVRQNKNNNTRKRYLDVWLLSLNFREWEDHNSEASLTPYNGAHKKKNCNNERDKRCLSSAVRQELIPLMDVNGSHYLEVKLALLWQIYVTACFKHIVSPKPDQTILHLHIIKGLLDTEASSELTVCYSFELFRITSHLCICSTEKLWCTDVFIQSDFVELWMFYSSE